MTDDVGIGDHTDDVWGVRIPDLPGCYASGNIAYAAGEAAVLIGALIDEGRTLRANVTFDAGSFGAIDAAAKARGLTCSAFLASAAREKIAARR